MTRMTLIGLRLRALTEYTRTRARNGIQLSSLTFGGAAKKKRPRKSLFMLLFLRSHFFGRVTSWRLKEGHLQTASAFS